MSPPHVNAGVQPCALHLQLHAPGVAYPSPAWTHAEIVDCPEIWEEETVQSCLKSSYQNVKIMSLYQSKSWRGVAPGTKSSVGTKEKCSGRVTENTRIAARPSAMLPAPVPFLPRRPPPNSGMLWTAPTDTLECLLLPELQCGGNFPGNPGSLSCTRPEEVMSSNAQVHTHHDSAGKRPLPCAMLQHCVRDFNTLYPLPRRCVQNGVGTREFQLHSFSFSETFISHSHQPHWHPSHFPASCNVPVPPD